jgi:recombination protein RecA
LTAVGAGKSSVDIGALYDKAVKEHGIVDRGPLPYVIPTGSILLDRALVIGGLAGGRVIEIYGPEMSGKTTICLHACVNAQRMGLPFGIVDMEAALDMQYFRNLGVQGEPNVDWLVLSPDTGEDALSIVEDWIKGGVKLIVVDSVAALVPKAELEGEMGEAFMGLHARMMGQGLRKITSLASKHGATVVFINQVRMKIGVVFGNPETTTGGRALAFWASMRIDIRQVGDPYLNKEGEQIGKASKVTVKKNKLAPPMKTAMVPIIWGRGVARERELLDILLLEGLISKASSYFKYKDQSFAGRDAACTFILEHMEELEAVLEAKHGPGQA